MQARRPSAVCFDLDGTLIDSEPLWIDAEVEIMARMGSDWSLEDQAYCLGGPLPKVAARMRERAGSQRTAESISDELINEMIIRLHSDVPWLEGARSAVSAMAESGPVALVTASPRQLVNSIVGSMRRDLGFSFSLVITGDDGARTKPHPDPYLMACEHFLSSPTDVLVIEDSVTGCTSAAAAGCIVLARSEDSPLDALEPHLHPHVMHVQPSAHWDLEAAWAKHPLKRAPLF